MRNVITVLKKIFCYYPLNYTIVTIQRIIGFAGLGILSGVIVKMFFDQIQEHTIELNSLFYITALLIVVPLVQSINYYIDLSLSYGWVEIIRGYFRRNIFRELLHKPGAEPLAVKQGQLSNVIRNDVTVHEGLLWDLSYLLAYAVFSVAGLIVLSTIDWMVTILLFVPLLVTLIVVNWLKRKITTYFENVQKSTDNVLGLISDIFNYSLTIKINNAEKGFINRLQELSDERARHSRKNAVFTTSLASIYDNIVNIGTALLLLLISSKIQQGTFSIGSFTLFIYFLGYIANLTRLFGTSLANFKSSTISLDRIKDVIGDNYLTKLTAGDSLYLKTEPPKIQPKIDYEPLNSLDIKGLSYFYPESENGIKDISITLPKGSFTVITGRIGSGKSTLLRVILGLLPKKTGEVMWNGENITEPSNFFIPPNAAYIPQVPYLFSETLRDNILLGHTCRDDKELEDAIYQAVLDNDLSRIEGGLDTLLGSKGTNLSGGQVQRTAAARMFVRNAQFLVLDDISSALDVGTEINLWERLDKYRQKNNVTLLVVTQKKYAMQYADQVIVLDKGEIKTQGTVQQMKEENEEIQTLFSS